MRKSHLRPQPRNGPSNCFNYSATYLGWTAGRAPDQHRTAR